MRESFGSSWTFQIMFAFILLFVSFLAVTVSFSRVFKAKNEVISIIEKYGGFNTTSADIINNYLQASGYQTTGSCGYGASATNNHVGILFDNSDSYSYNDGTKYNYCVKKEKASGNIAISDVTYEITMFYKFNIPIFGDFATFTVKGKTTDMIDPNNAKSNKQDDLFN